ncbi:chemotaxis response regulator protein-glutamate methylesterase [Hahella sp. CCB-MM4]|uniref:chemotaxis-specific protein-glutamate methyltransferase CheB n=1 Tax=Hahella sp. (strain CCB-MM4) TaxID=1926491 RepID=UPI000B9AC0D0|nr:chemotaxis-specific protein-glutamate methyltransferase CheB [Hahella sp. CCB-MM4]OZG71148.1 chemotaxis response regulator protein-glutamate methylesterase [Hahella sp. CCB-MM4]
MKVLIVDDSSVVRELLRHIIEAAGMTVVGEAENGHQAVEMAMLFHPNVITMDIDMPEMDGCEASCLIMENQPIPIVVVTASYSYHDTALAMKVLEAGAITVLQKPQGPGHPNFEKDAAALISTIRVISDIKLIRRTPRQPLIKATPNLLSRQKPEIIVIGASTGGPVALKLLLMHLTPPVPVPILVVQHISQGFLSSFCEWLANTTGFPVQIGEFGRLAEPGHVYLAPDNCHMEIDSDGHIRLSNGPPLRHNRPSIGHLFESVAKHFKHRTVAVLLSGMGQDGAQEMSQLHSIGALTLAQDEATAVVNGMPGEAVRLGAVSQVAPPQKLAEIINRVFASCR